MKTASFIFLFFIFSTLTFASADTEIEEHDANANFLAVPNKKPRVKPKNNNLVRPIFNMREAEQYETNFVARLGKLLETAVAGKKSQGGSLYTESAAKLMLRNEEGGATLARIIKHMIVEREQASIGLMTDEQLLKGLFSKYQITDGKYYAGLIKWGLEAKQLFRNKNIAIISAPPIRRVDNQQFTRVPEGAEDEAESDRRTKEFKEGFLKELSSPGK